MIGTFEHSQVHKQHVGKHTTLSGSCCLNFVFKMLQCILTDCVHPRHFHRASSITVSLGFKLTRFTHLFDHLALLWHTWCRILF